MQTKSIIILTLINYCFVSMANSSEDQTFPQESYIKASNPDEIDFFGSRVDISENTLVVSTNREASNATGVNGDELDNSALSAGAAYVFFRDEVAGWVQQAYIKASNAEADDQFGFDVAIEGDILVVGANFEDSSAQGVDGDQNDNSSMISGAVYVFTRENGIWVQNAYLKASNNKVDDGVNFPGLDQFGGAVAVSGNTIVVGAIGEDSSATGINGDEDDEGARSSGAVYVFVRDEGMWVQQAYLKASNTDSGDSFGDDVAIYGDTIVVGAPGEQSAASGINGDETDNTEDRSGAVYVFTRDSGIWSQQAYIKASNSEAEDRFGKVVDVFEDTILVGASGESSSATGVNGDQNDNSAEQAGAAYLFNRDQGIWTQQAYLKSSNSEAFDAFGFSISLAENSALIGARSEGSDATGVGGDQANNSAMFSGAGYLFARNDGQWSQTHYLKASNTEENDQFGSAVALDSNRLIISAINESSADSGVNGDQNNNDTLASGAVYTFNLDVIFRSDFESL